MVGQRAIDLARTPAEVREVALRDAVNAGHGDAVELVAAQPARGVAGIALEVRGGPLIALEVEAACGQEGRHLGWLHAEGEPLAGPLERCTQALRAEEELWAHQDVAVDVREDQATPGDRARAPAQGPVHRRL